MEEALLDNSPLVTAISVNDDLMEALDEFYDAIVDGVSFDDALDLYQADIDEGVASAIYLVVDLTV